MHYLNPNNFIQFFKTAGSNFVNGGKSINISKDTKYAARGGAIQILYVIVLLLQVIYQLLIARLFGAAIYGLYQGALSVLEILIRIAIFGTDKSMYRFIAGHREQNEKEQELMALGSGLRLNILVSLPMVFLTIIIARPLALLFNKPHVASFLAKLAPAILGSSLTIVIVAACMARRAAKAPLVVRGITEPVNLIVCALIAYIIGNFNNSLPIAHTIAILLTTVAAILFAGNIFGKKNLINALKSKPHAKFARFSYPIALLEGINTLRQQIDTILLLSFLPAEVVAFYKASDLVGRLTAFIRSAFDSIASPLFSVPIHAGDNERLSQNLRFLTRWVATLTIPIATSLIALRFKILELFGKEFVISASIIIIHILGHATNGIMGLCGNVLMMAGKSRYLIGNQILAVILNVIVCNLAIPRFGMVGAVLGFASAIITVVGLNVLETMVSERVNPFHKSLIKPFVAGAITLIIQVIIASHIVNGALCFTTTILLGMLLYSLILLLLVPGKEEREIIQRLISRFVK